MVDCSVIDVFCGIGGLTHGFIKEGFRVNAGYDLDESCRFAYERNNSVTFVCKNIEELTGTQLLPKFDKGLKVLVGCAPCQPFSKYTQGQKTQKWKLLKEFLRIITEVNPDIISMENVPELKRQHAFRSFVAALRKAEYHVSYRIVFCPEYGVPQSRRRLVLFASRFAPISLIPKTHPKTRYRSVRQAIGHMPRIAAGEQHRGDRIHKARNLNDINLKRIRATPEGGGWADWKPELMLKCHSKAKGKTYRSVYGRMRWDDLAPTLTTHCTGIGNGRFGHPSQDRAISLREAALLQTFPRWYRFAPPRKPVNNKALARQLGNAVPVRLGRIIARSIRRHILEIERNSESK